MNKQVTSMITLISVGILGMISCQSNSSVRSEDAQEVAEAESAKEEYLTDIEKFRQETGVTISANEQCIKELKASTLGDENEVKARYDQKINDLELKNAEMKSKLGEYDLEGKDRWNAFKKEFSHDMQEIENALEDLTVDNK